MLCHRYHVLLQFHTSYNRELKDGGLSYADPKLAGGLIVLRYDTASYSDG